MTSAYAGGSQGVSSKIADKRFRSAILAICNFYFDVEIVTKLERFALNLHLPSPNKFWRDRDPREGILIEFGNTGRHYCLTSSALAISNVLATRLGQKLPKPHLPVQKSSSASEFLEAAEARRIAAYARTSPSSEWEKQYAILRKTLLKMRAVGDTTSQAIIFNALSVLARRMGHMDEALDCIREAAALAIFSGDLALIQNVAFNFGNILSGIARHDPNSFKSDIFLGLIDLDIELRSRLRIGYDSAQAELLCSYLSYESGDFEGAGARLSQAEPVISVSQQPYDIALYERVKGLLLCDRHKPQDAQFYEGITALEASVTIYTNIGNLVAAEEVSRDLSLRREMLQSRT